MNTMETVALVGLGFLILNAKKAEGATPPANDTPGGNFGMPIQAGTVTPSGNVITEAIKNPAQGVDYINRVILRSTMSGAPASGKETARQLALLKKPQTAAGKPSPLNRYYKGGKAIR